MNRYKITPLAADYLKNREHAMRIDLYKGSMDVAAECLRDTDVVTAIEVIEHLYPDVLNNIPYNIFGFMQPKLVIFSTPNVDFNVHFETMPASNGFRHSDHKFEWTREQFRTWATHIVVRFPNYCVTFFGVGKAPFGSEDRGPVSQFALFVRRDIMNLPLTTEPTVEPAAIDPDFVEIYTADFPMRRDERTLDQQILDEANYTLNRYKYLQMFFHPERQIYLVPFERILLAVEDFTESASTLRRILLEKGYIIENDCIIVPEEDRRRSYWSAADSDCDIYEDEAEDDNADTSDDNFDERERNPVVYGEEESWD